MSFRIVLCVWSLGLLLCFGGGESLAATRQLSLQQALGILLRQNPALAKERLTIQQARADLGAARGVFSFTLDLDLKLNRSRLPSEQGIDASLQGVFGGDFALERLYVEGSLELTKRFSLGTVVSLYFQHWWTLNDTPRFSIDINNPSTPQVSLFQTHQASSTFRLQLVQPLLKGAWLTANLAPIWQAMERIKVAHAQVEQVATQFVAQVEMAYWELVYARQNMAIKRAALGLAQTQLKHTLALIKAGKLASLERFQVLQAIAARRGEVLLAQDAIAQAETQLRILLHLPVGVHLLPTDRPHHQHPLQPREVLLKQAFVLHPSLRIARRMMKISDWSVKGSKNATLPELNLVANFAFIGSGRIQVQNGVASPKDTSPIGRAFETLFDPRYHRFYVGVSLKIPLDNRAATQKLRRDQLEVQRATLEINRIRHQIRQEVSQFYAQVERTKRRILIAKASLRWAKKKLKAEQDKLALGQSTLFNVLTFQQDLSNARLSLLRAQIDHQKALTSLFEKAGLLLVRHGIGRKTP